MLIVVVISILPKQFVVNDVDLIMGRLKLFSFQNLVVLVELVTAGHDVVHLVLVSLHSSPIGSFALALPDCLGSLQVDLAKDWLHRVLLLSVEHLLLRAHALKEVIAISTSLARLSRTQKAAASCSTEGLRRDARMHGRMMMWRSSLAEWVVRRHLQHHRIADCWIHSGTSATSSYLVGSYSRSATAMAGSLWPGWSCRSSRHLGRLELE